MPTWNPDKAIEQLESKLGMHGTAISRVLMDHTLFPEHGLKVKADRKERECSYIWGLAIGPIGRPKKFFYDHTIRGAYLKARRAFKKELGPKKPSFKKKVRKKLAKVKHDE